MDPYEGRWGLKTVYNERTREDTFQLHIDRVAIPGALIDTDFTTTEWDKILEFYPRYIEHCRNARIMPLKRLEYTLLVCNVLAEQGVRKGRTSKDFFWRIADHFGRSWFNEHVLGDVR